jgi:hypothetical protein
MERQMRFAHAALAALLLLVGLVVANGWRQERQIRTLTADIRRIYHLPAKDVLSPIRTLDEILPDGLSPRQVVRRLQPLRDRVVRERWVAGEDVGRNPIHAHIIELRLRHGGPYGVAFVYRNDTLVDIDSSEHLGRMSDLPPDSRQAWVGSGIP